MADQREPTDRTEPTAQREPTDRTEPSVAVATGRSANAVRHLTAEERTKLGKAARARAPRSSQAEFDPGPDRPDPVALLERQATTRVPELVPIRYGRMLVSPFTFFRGAALVMASDLASTPGRASRPRSAAMPTCPTSVCSPHPSVP